jgi:hypothetical protein
MSFQSFFEEFFFIIQRSQVNHFLDGVSTFFVSTNLQEVLFHLLEDVESLLPRAAVEQLLSEIITVFIHHEFVHA